jgi:ATP-binding cassette subfamily B protein
MIIGVVIVMLVINIKLTLYVLAVTPLVAIFSILFRKISRQTHRDVRYGVANVNAFLSENLSGMKVTQVFNQEEKKLNEFRNHNNQLRKTQLKQTFIFGIFRPSMYVLYLVAVVLVFWFGGKESIGLSGEERLVAIATLIMFQQYIRQLFNPIQALADEFDLLQSAFASSEKIFEIMDTEPGIRNEDDAVELTDFRGEIEFKNVWFRYIEAEWVLKGVSFKINAGDTVAFVGATGSGKSTILSLIVRNYDIQKGQILIDGIDIKNIKLDSLRRNFGQMLQDVFLFSGTIASNIRMRDDLITDEDIIEASKYVNANKFVEELPEKYNEEVRERGNNFSSGQRQLLSFARTIVHKPNVIILDEATANIDTETEVLIQDSMEKMMNIGTMIIVAHRLSTIQHADKIIVMQKGEIIEEGTHQDLLKNKGHYFKLYELQYQSGRDIREI